jgi:predicted P-loop ATPase
VVSRFAGWPPSLGRQWWADTLRSVAEKYPINPRASWLRSLTWDGTSRLDTWVNSHVAAEPGPLNALLGRKWLISLVARWLDPGCKCDTVFILVGREGTRKSTFFEILAGGPERVVPLQGFERDDKFTSAKAWIVEMPEAALFRRADQNRLKAYITERVDQYRPPYAANPVTVKRGFVLVSTSNDLELFQPGQDGLRRFWPVLVRDNKLDLEWVAANRDQLLAEAVVAFDLEEEWWFDETPDALKKRQHDAVADTPVDDAIYQLIARQAGKGGLGLADLMTEITAILGYRPNDRLVSALLPRHGIWKKRTALARYWTHPSWENEKENVVEFKKAT